MFSLNTPRLLFLFLFFLTENIYLNAQTIENAEDVVHRFFNAMAQSDTIVMSSLLAEKSTLVSSYIKADVPSVGGVSKREFLESVIRSKPGELDEQISNLITQNDDGLATIWMDYAFYYKGTFSHCGVNTFTLVRKGDQWLIVAIADTRRKEDCSIELAKNQIDEMLVRWHQAASEADSAGYFGLMSPDAIYVGTDKSEVWSKDEFLSFASPYFARGKAWDFKTISRNIYADDFTSLAWFDEMLDTWMGPCRGSGIVVRDNNGDWKVKHYVLSVTVDNDDIKEFLKIVEK